MPSRLILRPHRVTANRLRSALQSAPESPVSNVEAVSTGTVDLTGEFVGVMLVAVVSTGDIDLQGEFSQIATVGAVSTGRVDLFGEFSQNLPAPMAVTATSIGTVDITGDFYQGISALSVGTVDLRGVFSQTAAGQSGAGVAYRSAIGAPAWLQFEGNSSVPAFIVTAGDPSAELNAILPGLRYTGLLNIGSMPRELNGALGSSIISISASDARLVAIMKSPPLYEMMQVRSVNPEGYLETLFEGILNSVRFGDTIELRIVP